MKKTCNLLILSLLIAFSLAGCDKSAASTSTTNTSQKIVVTDGLGKKIELSKPVTRVLSSYPIAIQMICTLGAQDTLLGLDGKVLENPVTSPLVPNSKGTAKSKNTFDSEKALSLNPDLVLTKGSDTKTTNDMDSHGLQAFSVKAETLDGLKSTMTNLGKAFGKEKEAAIFNDYYRQKLDFVKGKLKNVNQNDKQKVYVAGSAMYTTAGTEMFQNSLIELCDGINVSSSLKGGWVEISPEQLIKWNPDVIVLTQYCHVTPADVLNNKSLKDVNAVKNKKVYLIPSKLTSWDMPCPQTVLGVLWLSQKLNPKVFTDIDITKEADTFYQKFYGTTFTKIGGKVD